MKRFDADNLKNVYSPYHEPYGSVEQGETFQVETEDGFGGRFKGPEDFNPETVDWVEENLCVVTGPIYVEGAKPGDVVAIKIEEIKVTTPGHFVLSRYSDPSPQDWWLEEYSIKTMPVEDNFVLLNDKIRVPVEPIIGCLATAPATEVILSKREGDFGGNIDCNAVSTGSTVILPVNVEGAYLYFGDCKAAMADGEIVNAPEVGTLITASASVRPRPESMNWPRVETDKHLITVVSDISLSHASRIAFKELLFWLEEDYSLSRLDAALLMGMVAHSGICQVSNTFHTAQCAMPREMLPDPTRP